MKTRILYTFGFCVYGFIGGMLLSLVVLALISGIYWMYIFGDNSWPAWAYFVLKSVYWAVFTCVLAASAVYGMNYGKKKEKSAQGKAAASGGVRFLIWSLLSLIIFSISFYIHSKRLDMKEKELAEQEKKNAQVMQYRREIKQIDITQDENGINVTVFIPGPTEGRFLLELSLKSIGYVKEPLLNYSSLVELNLPKQNFNFYIPFEKLGEVYKEKLLNYIPFLEREFQIDEYVELEAGLSIEGNAKYSPDTIKSVVWPKSRQHAVLRFNFSCFKESCRVLQSKDNLKLETTNGKSE